MRLIIFLWIGVLIYWHLHTSTNTKLTSIVPPSCFIIITTVCVWCCLGFRGPFVSALGKSWCPDHFVCANPQCGVKLLNVGFVEDGGHLYCERDYSKFFAPHCKHCSLAIIGVSCFPSPHSFLSPSLSISFDFFGHSAVSVVALSGPVVVIEA